MGSALKNYVAIVLLAMFTLTACSDGGENTVQADKVFVGAKIYTVDDANPLAEAVAVKDGRIIYVGDASGVSEFVGDGTETIDLTGAYMFPGFTDSHAHLLGIGMRELTLNLEGVASIAQVREKVAAAIVGLPAGEFLYGRGWIETHWPEERFLTKQDLDDLSPNNPVVLSRADGHAIVANSLALALINITRDSQQVEGGEIHFDENGEPSGLLVDNARGNLLQLATASLRSSVDAAYAKASDVYAAYGWTGIHAMSVDPDNVGRVEGLSDEGVIGIRVYNSIDLVSSGIENTAAVDNLFATGGRKSRNGQVITRAIKIYLDGALGSRGAALLEPYADADTQGLMIGQKQKIMPVLERALRTGVQINSHAIGDRANRALLNWYEEAFANVPKTERSIAEPRWRDEHSQIIDPSDIPRFEALGVIPSVQPSHAIGDLFFAPSRLGSDRLEGAYAWQSLLDTGSIVLAGSDAPVERGDPRIEFYAAVARMSLDGFYNDDWNRQQAVAREDALKMLTLWPAYGSFQETDLGSIEVGKFADFSVFSGDIMSIAYEDILTVKTVMTVVAGNVIYSSE